MSKLEIVKSIISKLEESSPVPGDTDEAKLAYRYLDAGHIDSLSVINFIVDLEEEFEVSLSPEDTQSDQFRTVGGLVTLIETKMNEKK